MDCCPFASVSSDIASGHTGKASLAHKNKSQ
jgi:hypothetical protein